MIDYVKAGYVALRKPVVSHNKPLHLQIEPSTHCNLKCKFCVREKIIQKPANMTVETFEYIFNSIEPKRVTFAGAGEPLMNPELPRMISYSRERGASTIVTSNFTLGDRFAEDLVESGLSAVRISIDAATSDTYFTVRGQDRFEDIIEGIRALNEAKKEQSSQHPEIGFEFVLTKDNLYDVPGILNLGKELGINRVNFRPLNLIGIEEKEASLLGDFASDDFMEILVGANRSAREINMHTNLASLIKSWDFYWNRYKPEFANQRKVSCLYPWLQAYVSIDGKITPCCSLQMDEGVDMGNILEDGFANVWNGERYQRLRRNFRKGKVSFKSCKTCDYRSLVKVANLALTTPGFLHT